jgi:hypothetical protein
MLEAAGLWVARRKSKTGSRLFASPDVASVARLTQPCGGEGDFNSLMSAQADVLGQVVTPGRAALQQRAALEQSGTTSCRNSTAMPPPVSPMPSGRLYACGTAGLAALPE